MPAPTTTAPAAARRPPPRPPTSSISWGALSAAWGPVEPRPRAAGTLGAARALPQVRAWDRPGAPGLVRVEPVDPEVVVDGSGEGLAALAAFGPVGDVAYAGDLTTEQIRRAGEIVITDSNRRRILVPSRLAQNAGPVLAAGEQPSVDAALLNPFPSPDAQTVAVYGDIAAVRAPSSPGFPQFPEHRPYAALDGDRRTHWQADRALTDDRHVLEVDFTAPREVGALRLLPYNDRRAKVKAVVVNGSRYPVHAGWNHLPVGLSDVTRLSVQIVTEAPDGENVAAGIRELEIPNVGVTEALRPPVLAERALRGGGRLGQEPHVRVPAHHGRRPVPPRERARLGERGARA